MANLTHLVSFTSDMGVLIILFLIFFGITFWFGRGIIVAFILSFYPSVLLYLNLPFLDKLMILQGDKLLLLNRGCVFLLLFILITVIINSYVSSLGGLSGGGENLLKASALSLTGVLLVLILSYSVLNLDMLHDFSPSIDALFSSNARLFWWNIVPFVVLAVF